MATKQTIEQQEADLTDRLAKLQAVKPTRLQLEALDAGKLPAGTRLVDFTDRENGVNIVFDDAEAVLLVPVLRQICEARLKAAGVQ